MKKFDAINVIPFIDIMLVLLAIVLTTATFISNGQLDIALPKATNDATSEAVEKIEIAIDKDEQLYYSGIAHDFESLDAELRALESGAAIVLRIDENVPFAQFVRIIDLLKTLKLDNVSILTQKSVS